MSIKTHIQGLYATDIALDGRGIASVDGKRVFVKGLAPNESANVNVVAESQHHNKCWAEIVERTSDLSDQRQEPPCPSHGHCGGCAWQHLSYAAQCDFKQKHVLEALKSVVKDDAKNLALPFIPSPQSTGYRNKGIYVIAGKAPKLFLGAYTPGTHTPVSTLKCKNVNLQIDVWAHKVCAALNTHDAIPYDDVHGHGWLRYCLIRKGEDGQCHITLIGKDTSPMSKIKDIAQHLHHEGALGVAWIQNDHTDGRVLSEHPTHLEGKTHVTESLNGNPIEVSPYSFFQVNPEAAKLLYVKLVKLLAPKPEDVVLDLFCGVGGFAFHLSEHVKQVHGVEFNEECIASARKHAKKHASNVSFEVGDAKGVDIKDVDVIVVNPPRKGLGKKLSKQINESNVQTMAYVSCNPTSLASDLESLTSAFELRSMQSIDLMPGTGHVETIVVLDRRKGMSK